MTTTPFKDYYKILGVLPTATDDEITQKYRTLALKLRADINPQNEEEFKKIGEAYEALGGGFGIGEARTKKREEYDEKYRSSKEAEYHVQIPENDLGLLAALKKAYSSKQQGIWNVKTSETDERDWMPRTVYQVQRKEDGTVTIFRTIKDWRYPSMRDSEIKFHNNNNPLKSEALIHEYYLSDAGSSQIRGGGIAGTTYLPPLDYDTYLADLKSMAKKLIAPTIEGKYPIGKELESIAKYTKGMRALSNFDLHYHIRMENVPPDSSNEDNEIGRRIPISDFLSEVKYAEKRVVTITPLGKEGQQKLPESENGGFSGGENKG